MSKSTSPEKASSLTTSSSPPPSVLPLDPPPKSRCASLSTVHQLSCPRLASPHFPHLTTPHPTPQTPLPSPPHFPLPTPHTPLPTPHHPTPHTPHPTPHTPLPPKVRNVFEHLDTDGDGVVTREDLLRALGTSISDEEVDKMFHQLCAPAPATCHLPHALCARPCPLPPATCSFHPLPPPTPSQSARRSASFLLTSFPTTPW